MEPSNVRGEGQANADRVFGGPRGGYNHRVADGLSDTDPEARRVHLELIRQASPGKRLRLALSLSRSVMTLSRLGLAQRHPDDSPEEIGLRFVSLHYGADLANELRSHLSTRRA